MGGQGGPREQAHYLWHPGAVGEREGGIFLKGEKSTDRKFRL